MSGMGTGEAPVPTSPLDRLKALADSLADGPSAVASEVHAELEASVTALASCVADIRLAVDDRSLNSAEAIIRVEAILDRYGLN
ncbi:hypothetical protein SEA_ZETA1847_59 [Microbacterium phage Zeta1847]|uniref:Uncharacterized protein n=1 Tax=Microbacterium phage Zeta1847 TaxID=2201444 RepID=A0A2Z4QAR1_9CAUD|nr:hypothetical protein HOT46_gp59 [Microbacterium phage Zeta1847]AWY06693.1 hypothetical protein SEA_ZETA1847_59 [Microbacterium phage Zeta1847]